MHHLSVDLLYKPREGSRLLARAILDKAPWLWRLKIVWLVVGLALQSRNRWRRRRRLEAKHVAFLLKHVAKRLVFGSVANTSIEVGLTGLGFKGGACGFEGGDLSLASLARFNHLLVVRNVVRGKTVNLVETLEGFQVAFPAFQAGRTRLVVALLMFVIQGLARLVTELVGLACQGRHRDVAETALGGVADFAERHSNSTVETV
jgi:hypothetical protein